MLGIITKTKHDLHRAPNIFKSIIFYDCIENNQLQKNNSTTINLLKYNKNSCELIAGQLNSYVSGQIISIEEDGISHIYIPDESQVKELLNLLYHEKKYLMHTPDLVLEQEKNIIELIVFIEDAIGTYYETQNTLNSKLNLKKNK